MGARQNLALYTLPYPRLVECQSLLGRRSFNDVYYFVQSDLKVTAMHKNAKTWQIQDI